MNIKSITGVCELPKNFIDVYGRKVGEWAVERRMQDKLVIDAFNQAYYREKPKEGIIVHTDQGSQYTGAGFQDLLRQKNVVKKLIHAIMLEPFYKTLK